MLLDYRDIYLSFEPVGGANNKAYRLAELEEVLGELHSIEVKECGLVAVIGKVRVWLPEELAVQLEGLKGRRVAVLRLDGYHVRCFEGEMHA
jgi:hypothetical protein